MIKTMGKKNLYQPLVYNTYRRNEKKQLYKVKTNVADAKSFN